MAYKGPQVVIGPASSTDNTIPRFNLTSGALIQGSSLTIDDSDVLSGATQINVDNLRLDGNTISSTDTNGNVVLAPDGTGTVSVTTAPIVPSGDRADSLGSTTNSWDNVYADGLTFDDGTNVLANYVDFSSWTPVLEFGGATTGITYTVQTGSYVRIGNVVFVRVSFQLSSSGSATGNATITGFPFTFRTGGGSQTSAVGQWNAVNLSTNYTQVIFNCNDGTSTIRLYECGDNVSFISTTHADYTTNSSIVGNFVVFID